MIDDTELLLFHWGEGLDSARRAQIEHLLRSDPALARRLRQLREGLAALPDPALHAPAEAALARWRLRLDQRARNAQPARAGGRWRLALAGASLLLFGITVGTRLGQLPTVAAPPPPQVAAAPAAEASLGRGLRSHLDGARLLLADLPGDDPLRRRALVDEVIAQNRVYARVAADAGDLRLARVLRAFEPVLEALAEPPAVAGGDLGARAQVDFELAILQTKLSRSPSKIVQSL